MKKLLLFLTCVLTLFGAAKAEEYTLVLTAESLRFDSSSYTNNNGNHTVSAMTPSGKTMEVVITSNQVYKRSGTTDMQWQKSTGYLQNSTDLGKISSITIGSTAGTYTVYGGSKQSPSTPITDKNGFFDFSETGYGYFKINVGSSATGYVSEIIISFKPKTKVDLFFSSFIAQATIGEVFEAPELTVNPSEALSEVIYSSTDNNVADIDANGNVSIKLPGETKIKAEIKDSPEYTNAEAEYTLIVIDPNGGGENPNPGGDTDNEDIRTDVLENKNTIKNSSASSYSTWIYNSITSGAVYSGYTAGSNNSIQLTNDTKGYGIVTTTSGGKIKSVKVKFNTNTTTPRQLDIYASNTAYTETNDLYSSDKKGTNVTSFTYSSSAQTEFTYNFTENYQYIGFISNKSAMYIDKIEVEWEPYNEPTTPQEPKDYTSLKEYLEGVNNQISFPLNGNAQLILGDSHPEIEFKEQDSNILSFTTDGKITATATGTATVTASWNAVENVWNSGSTSFTVTVTDSQGGGIGTVPTTGSSFQLVTNASDIVDGGYYVIAFDGDNSTTYAVNPPSGSYLAAGVITKTGNTVKAQDNNLIFKLEQSGNQWLWIVTNEGSNKGQAMMYSGSSTNTKLGSTNEANAKTSVTLQDDNTVKIEFGTSGRALLGYQNASFRAYSTYGSNTWPNLYKYVETDPSLIDPELSFSEKEATAYIGEAFSAPTLTNNYGLTVTYKSSDPTVATVNSDGEVTALKVGTTKISASTEADQTYSAGYAEYTLTVVDPNITVTNYTLVTDIKELGDEAEIIIINSDGNKAISTTQNTNNRSATPVTVKEDKTIEPTEEIEIFIVTKVNDKYTIFAKKGDKATNNNNAYGYLYAVKGNNYLRTSQTTVAEASITIDNEIATILFNAVSGEDSEDRFLKYNSNNDIFSCYTDGQNDIKIYMKSNGPEIGSDPEPSLYFEFEGKKIETFEANWNATPADLPTLNSPEDIGNLTFDSSNMNVATIDPLTGEITFQGVEGETIISVASEAVEGTYGEGKAEYILYVFNPESMRYTFDFVENTYNMSRASGNSEYNGDQAILAEEKDIIITNYKNENTNGTRLHNDGLRFYKADSGKDVPYIILSSQKVDLKEVIVIPEQYFTAEKLENGSWKIYFSGNAESPQSNPLKKIDIVYAPYPVIPVIWTHEATGDIVEDSHTGTHRVAHQYRLASADPSAYDHSQLWIDVKRIVNNSEISTLAASNVDYEVTCDKDGVVATLYKTGTYTLTPTIADGITGILAVEQPITVTINPLKVTVNESAFTTQPWSNSATGNEYVGVFSYESANGETLTNDDIKINVTANFDSPSEEEANAEIPDWLQNQMKAILDTKGNRVDGYDSTSTAKFTVKDGTLSGTMEATMNVMFGCSGVYNIQFISDDSNIEIDNSNQTISVYPSTELKYAYTIETVVKGENGENETITSTFGQDGVPEDGLNINYFGSNAANTIYMKSENLSEALLIIPGIYLEDIYYNINGEIPSNNSGTSNIKRKVSDEITQNFIKAENYRIDLSSIEKEGTLYLILVKNGAQTPYGNAENYSEAQYQIVINPDATPTGIEGIDAEDGEAEYYDLNGFRVNPENLQKGIYIVKKGKETYKVIP